MKWDWDWRFTPRAKEELDAQEIQYQMLDERSHMTEQECTCHPISALNPISRRVPDRHCPIHGWGSDSVTEQEERRWTGEAIFVEEDWRRLAASLEERALTAESRVQELEGERDSWKYAHDLHFADLREANEAREGLEEALKEIADLLDKATRSGHMENAVEDALLLARDIAHSHSAPPRSDG